VIYREKKIAPVLSSQLTILAIHFIVHAHDRLYRYGNATGLVEGELSVLDLHTLLQGLE
jgi:hypothetical protein